VIDFFGTVSDNTLKAGVNPVNPLARVIKFSVQTHEAKGIADFQTIVATDTSDQL